jgi:AcrR family transcriptional regulator
MTPDLTQDDLWNESVSAHKARQGEQIAMAAMELVATSGMSSLTMSAIAHKAGISRQTLYRYYPDIESVLTAAITSSTSLETHLEALTAEGTPGEQLDALVEMILQGAAAGHPSPTTYEQSLPPQAREAARQHALQVEQQVAEIIQRGLADGSFSTELDPKIDGAILYRLIMAAYDLAANASEPAFIIQHVRSSVHRLVDRDGLGS